MPNKPHAPRKGGTGSSKKSAAAIPEGSDYIQFGDSKKKGKTSSGSNAATGASTLASSDKSKAKGKKDGDAPGVEDAPKKPTAREVIGGASWTGKLPQNLFNEHCQRMKWEKPEYTMSKRGDSFSSFVILRQKNPKTGDVTELPPFKLHPDHQSLAHQPSALEARHFAAAYALFRVCSMKNIHMTMPPQFRDLWKNEFAEMKKKDIEEHREWMYADDPFKMKKEREAAQVEKQKKLELRAKEQAARAKEQGPGMSMPSINSSGGKDPLRGWKTVPKVEMGKRVRRDVEAIVRMQAAWNPSASKLAGKEKDAAVAHVTSLGFRKSHVEEAVELCRDQEEILEWLLIHVPEDDLPKWSLPENYAAGVSMASGDMRRDAAVTRLAAGGYAVELVEDALDQAQNAVPGPSGSAPDMAVLESKAACILQDRLLESFGAGNSDTIEAEADANAWSEEQEVLASIFDARYEKVGPNACRIRMEMKAGGEPIHVLLRPSEQYPATPLIIFILAKLPAYIRLSITKQALEYLRDHCLGQQMAFSVIDWLDNETTRIIEHPGRLSDVAAVGSASAPQISANTKQRSHTKRRRHPEPLIRQPGNPKSMQILQAWQARRELPQQQEMLRTREKLPAWSLRERIAELCRTYQVVIVSGETGSGKSTQSVQFVLDDLIQRKIGDAVNIICTQPRRISALGLADRVADERCGKVGDEVGYSIRGESKTSANTKLTFVTTGVLLRRLQTSGGSTQDVVDSLANVSHVVIDEVHERSLDTDFLLALLRDVIQRRKDLKLILMSATLDADVFERYFGGPEKVAKVEIQGRTFPVTDHYLDDIVQMTNFRMDESLYSEAHDEEEDGGVNGTSRSQGQNAAPSDSIGKQIQRLGAGTNYDLIKALVAAIDRQLGSSDGGILIFLPGAVEISRTLDALRSLENVHALPLHASLLPVEQRKVFQRPPPGKRKVIASTNVAETSITISDIVAVIDSGRVKETRFDPQNQMVKLEDVWTSRAAGKQRRGRAGRVRAGDCYKLYTRAAESKMPERPEPEIRRTPLEQLCLSVKAMGAVDVSAFLSATITPPEANAVQGALRLLQQMGALDENALTSLGQHMAMIPADLRCAKLMIYGALFGCLEAAVTISSILTVRSPFVSPKDKRNEAKAARESFADNQGDLFADLNAYNEWNSQRQSGARYRELQSWCGENFLSQQTLNDISTTRGQYLSSLKEIGFLSMSYRSSSEISTAGSGSNALLHALILGSLYPQIVRVQLPSTKYQATSTGSMAIDPEAREIRFYSASAGPDSRVFVHPSSTMFSAQTFYNNAPFLSYFQRVMTSKAFIREITPCSAYGVLLFGGRRVALDTAGRGLTIGGKDEGEENEWRFRGWARIGVLVGRLRSVLDSVLGRWIEEPGTAGSEGLSQEQRLIDVVRRLVEREGLDN